MTATTDTALRAAMDRLIAGRPRCTDGKLTISNLAREAGVGRATANRATKVLAEFRAAIVRQQDRQQGPAALRARLRQLEAELMAQCKLSSEEIDTLRATVQQMAQHIQALTRQAAAQTRQIAQLRAAINESGKVVMMPMTRRRANEDGGDIHYSSSASSSK